MTHLLLGFSLICFFIAGVISEYRINRRLTWLDEEVTEPNAYLQQLVDEADEEWRRIYERGK